MNAPMTATQYSLRSSTSRRASGSYQTADGRVVSYTAREGIDGLTYVALSICGRSYAEVHIGEVVSTLAPAITGRCGREVFRLIAAALVRTVR